MSGITWVYANLAASSKKEESGKGHWFSVLFSTVQKLAAVVRTNSLSVSTLIFVILPNIRTFYKAQICMTSESRLIAKYTFISKPS